MTIRYYADDNEQPDGTEVEGRDLGTATAVRETAKALLFMREDLSELWVPKSCVHSDSEVFSMKSCGPGKLVVAEWWAEENEVA